MEDLHALRIRLFRLTLSGLDPRVEQSDACLFEVTGITQDDRQVIAQRRSGDAEVWL
jgi:hypothetical protein